LNIQIIEELEFKKIEASRRAIAHDHARNFAVLDLGDTLGCYGLSWRSELVEPIVELSSDELAVWVESINRLQQFVCLKVRFVYLCALNSNLGSNSGWGKAYCCTH
jgi:hypothetical protein